MVKHKLLYLLDKNARTSVLDLSRQLKTSKTNVIYNLHSLEKNGYIESFTTIINMHKLGFFTYRIYYRVKSANYISKIIREFKKSEHVIWLVTLAGSWDIEVVLGSRNPIELNSILDKIYDKIGKYIRLFDISMSTNNIHFYREYLVNEKRQVEQKRMYGGAKGTHQIDKIDFDILNTLTQNCRLNASEIGRKVKVSYKTVQQRIKVLEKNKIIQGYRVKIDFNKIQKEYHKILIKTAVLNKQIEEQLLMTLGNFQAVVYVVTVLGNDNIEVECEVSNSDELLPIIRSVQEILKEDLLDYTTLKVLKEYKLNYLPLSYDTFISE